MSNRTLTYVSKIIMLGVQFLVDRTRHLDAAINERARDFVRKNRWLGRLERHLDLLMLSTFAIAMGLDYAVTVLCCDHPSLEAHPLARYLMRLYGIHIGLGLTAIVSLIIVLSLSYGLYRFSNWHMRRVNLEFPVLRKLGTYSILLIAALKCVNGAFSWLEYGWPSDYTMTFAGCTSLPEFMTAKTSVFTLTIDGRVDVSKPASGRIRLDDRQVLIGDNSQKPGRFWNGLIDDVRIYSYGLTAEEVAALCASRAQEK